MKLDGFGLLVKDMPTMVRFYRDVMGFEITEGENAQNVYLIKDGTLFMLYERKNFEKMTSKSYQYTQGINGHFEIALYVDTFEQVDREYHRIVGKGATPVMQPTTEPWGQRTCYVADPEGNLIEIGSFNRPFEERN
ncbi:MAG: VOC family protein [Clostridia bacterium]|nr:VOC family protein [Clostridia bacterium]MBQ8872395.1 VOC family protein [Clostridia bacterium]MBQ9707268.1 VOC family protein [Clostridia bacterium]